MKMMLESGMVAIGLMALLLTGKLYLLTRQKDEEGALMNPWAKPWAVRCSVIAVALLVFGLALAGYGNLEARLTTLQQLTRVEEPRPPQVLVSCSPGEDFALGLLEHHWKFVAASEISGEVLVELGYFADDTFNFLDLEYLSETRPVVEKSAFGGWARLIWYPAGGHRSQRIWLGPCEMAR